LFPALVLAGICKLHRVLENPKLLFFGHCERPFGASKRGNHWKRSSSIQKAGPVFLPMVGNSARSGSRSPSNLFRRQFVRPSPASTCTGHGARQIHQF
jgi:hypothetical protein